MPKKRFEINKQDLDTFHEAMKGVKPLNLAKTRAMPPALHKKPLARHLREDKIILNFKESLILDTVQGEEFISYKQAGVSHKILRNLRKGQYNVEATLDLHGYIVEDARMAVDEFLKECLHEGMRVVLIIHGKGHGSEMPILKNKLNHWLRGLSAILAFCSAAPLHGSRGAIYILLKRHAGDLTLE